MLCNKLAVHLTYAFIAGPGHNPRHQTLLSSFQSSFEGQLSSNSSSAVFSAAIESILGRPCSNASIWTGKYVC